MVLVGAVVKSEPDAEADAKADPQNIMVFGTPGGGYGQQRMPRFDPGFYHYVLPVMINNLVWGLENAAAQGKTHFLYWIQGFQVNFQPIDKEKV